MIPALDRRGIKVWRDIAGIPGGAKWRDSLVQALARRAVVLLLMSRESLASNWRQCRYRDASHEVAFDA